MKQKEILLFGATGQIGRNLVRKLSKNNYKITAVTRNIHRKGYQIKTQSNYGYLELEEINSFNEENVSKLMENPDIDPDQISLGVGKSTDFTWKQLLDSVSCTECSRCTSVCPANSTGKLLSPM